MNAVEALVLGFVVRHHSKLNTGDTDALFSVSVDFISVTCRAEDVDHLLVGLSALISAAGVSNSQTREQRTPFVLVERPV